MIKKLLLPLLDLRLNSIQILRFFIPVMVIGIFLMPSQLHGQCSNLILPDSSFELGSLTNTGTPDSVGHWERMDGCEIEIVANAPEGDSAACSISGGAYQYIVVRPFTHYYVTCQVLNGATDYEGVRLGFDFLYDPMQVATNNWTQISNDFTTTSDTIISFGFYSSGACFDKFQLTCQPVISNDLILESPAPFSLAPNVTSDLFQLQLQKPCSIKVLDPKGRIVFQKQLSSSSFAFGQEFPSGLYIMELSYKGQSWFKKLLKQ